MPVGGNLVLIGFTGVIQQKNALAAYNKQITKVSSGSRTSGPGEHRSVAPTEKQEQDTTAFSRVGIAALETTQVIGDETVIRGDDSAVRALDYSRTQIIEHTDDALMAQANQVSEQLLALYKP
jgi:hypothetical protein